MLKLKACSASCPLSEIHCPLAVRKIIKPQEASLKQVVIILVLNEPYFLNIVAEHTNKQNLLDYQEYSSRCLNYSFSWFVFELMLKQNEFCINMVITKAVEQLIQYLVLRDTHWTRLVLKNQNWNSLMPLKQLCTHLSVKQMRNCLKSSKFY